MRKYNEELSKAGVLLDLSGLQGTARATRIKFSPGGKKTVVDGPFTESKELVAGFWIIDVKSREEAVEWAKRAPAPHGPDQESEIEVREFVELEDYLPARSCREVRGSRKDSVGKTFTDEERGAERKLRQDRAKLYVTN